MGQSKRESQGNGSQAKDAAQGLSRLSLLQKQLTIVVLVLAVLFLLAQIAIFFADILRILGISILLSYLFINVVDFMERYVRSRALAIGLVYLVLGAVTIIGAILVLPAMIFQITQLVNSIFEQIPQMIEWLVGALRPLEARLHAAKIDVKAIDILSNLAVNLPKPDANQIIGRMTDVAMSTMTWLIYALSVLVVSFYFMLDGHRIRDSIIGFFPERHRLKLRHITGEVDRSLQAFFKGQIVLAIAFGAMMILVYLSLGLPYALLLGVVLAFWEIVPVIGPPIGFLPAIIVVAIDGMEHVPLGRIWQILLLFAIFNGLQWLKDNLVAPKYIGNVIGLHPVTIFIAIMIGARIDGMLGIIFSLPVACVVNIVLNNMGDEEPVAVAASVADEAGVPEGTGVPESTGAA